MTTIKSFTDIDQSKKLAEILPPESADMNYTLEDFVDEDSGDIFSMEKVSFGHPSNTEIGCWSLAALLGVLPQSITKYIESAKCQKTFHLNLFRSYYCCISYDEMPSVNDDNSLYCIGRDNWIDACYEIIIKLKELNLL